MKKTVFIGICFLFLISNHVMAQGIKFYPDFDKAHTEAVKQNKMLFIDFYTSWCGPCKMMSRDVFPLEAVGQCFNANYISVKVDAEKEGKELAKKYDVSAYPTMLFITTDGEVVNKILGAVDDKKLIEAANKTLKLINDPNNLTNLKKQYQQKKNDPEFLNLYITTMKRMGEAPFQAIDDYLKVQKTMIPRSSKMMEYLIKNSNYLILGGAAEQIFNQNEQWYRNLSTKSEEKKLNEIRNQMMRLTQAMALEEKNVELYEIFLDRWSKLKEKPHYQTHTGLSLELLKLKGDTKQYKKRAVNYLDSIVSAKPIAEIWANDKSRYDQFCKENPGRGMYAESMRASYKELDARMQVIWITEVGSSLLETAKKSDYKHFEKWIEYGRAVLPNNFVIPNFQANVLYTQGKKEEAIKCKTEALNMVKLGYKARQPIEDELAAMKNGTFVKGEIIVR